MEDQAIYTADEVAKLSQQERAILHLLEDSLFAQILRPVCIGRKGSPGITDIFFSRLEYGVLSGGEKTAVSWAYAIWRDEVNQDPDWRDPFDGFGILSLARQKRILEAMAIRHDMNREISPLEKYDD